MTLLGAVIIRDIFANRPSASIAGRLFFATDTGNQYRDNGTSWDLWGAAGGAVTVTGSPAPVAGQLAKFSGPTSITDGTIASSDLPPLNFQAQFPGKPIASQYVFSAAYVGGTFPANFAGLSAFAKCGTNPSDGPQTFTVKNGSTTIGTVTITTGGVVTLATSSGTSKSVTAEDFIYIYAPSTPDSTMADIVIDLQMIRS